MRRLVFSVPIFVGCMVCFFSPLGSAQPPRPSAPGIIFDTDLGADIDDALALAMLHALEDRGLCKLLAVTLTNADPRSPRLAQLINHFYGRADLPVGRAVNKLPAPSDYLKTVDLTDGEGLRYPHQGKPESELTDSPTLIRRILAGEPDHSVILIQVGYSSNLKALLDAPPDAISPLSGLELARSKVRLLSIMAGAFTPIGNDKRFKEYNVKGDLPATIALAERWPTPIVWSGFEIGIAAAYPARSIEQDFSYVTHHPVADAYRLYQEMPYDRPTWDLTSVLYALHPERGYFELSEPGRVTVEADGFTRFDATAGGRDRYLILNPEHRERLVEALTQLASQPPRIRP
jgi:inosine-uridine nucleoside N-ribohydrolase